MTSDPLRQWERLRTALSRAYPALRENGVAGNGMLMRKGVRPLEETVGDSWFGKCPRDDEGRCLSAGNVAFKSALAAGGAGAVGKAGGIVLGHAGRALARAALSRALPLQIGTLVGKLAGTRLGAKVAQPVGAGIGALTRRLPPSMVSQKLAQVNWAKHAGQAGGFLAGAVGAGATAAYFDKLDREARQRRLKIQKMNRARYEQLGEADVPQWLVSNHPDFIKFRIQNAHLIPQNTVDDGFKARHRAVYYGQ